MLDPNKEILIYDPERDTPPGSRLISFPRPAKNQMLSIGGTNANKKNTANSFVVNNLVLQATMIRPGMNQISSEEIEYIRQYPGNDRRFQERVFRVVHRQLEEGAIPKGNLEDYALQDAREIVNACNDIDLLRQWQYQQWSSKFSEVSNWCKARVDRLNQEIGQNIGDMQFASSI